MCKYEGGTEISSNNQPLKVRFNHDYSEGYLLEDFICKWDGFTIVVQKDFITDFASVPRWAWSFTPPFGQYTPAAVVHDWLYAAKPFTRSTCDKIFLNLMERLDVGWWKRQIMYYAVRVGGASCWSYGRLLETHFKSFADDVDTTHIL